MPATTEQSALTFSAADLRRFDASARILDRGAFKMALRDLVAQKAGAMSDATVPQQQAPKDVRALIAPHRWAPSSTDIQRGREAMLAIFNLPSNPPLAEFARLAGKSRQQIYRDLRASPPRLLALTAGSRGLRVPDWQLQPFGLRLTQTVLREAPGVDNWTVYGALAEPMSALEGRAPVQAVSANDFARVTTLVLNALGLR